MSVVSIFRIGLFVLGAALLAPYLGIHILTSAPNPLPADKQFDPRKNHHLNENPVEELNSEEGVYPQKSGSDEDAGARPQNLNDIERLLNQ